MKISFPGTGAADWHGRDERGEIRRLTSTRIDQSILIDLTEEIFDMLEPDARITDVFFTHSHPDHFSIAAIERLKPERVYAHESWAGEIRAQGVQVVPLSAGEWVRTGEYEILPMPSNHSTRRANEQTLHFVIRKGETDFLYATDGAWLLNRELKLMEGMHLSGAAFDATIGDDCPGDYRVFEHNSLDMVRLMTATMKRTGLLKPDAKVFLTHLARTLHPTQKALEERTEKEFIVCYDGMKSEI